MRQALLLIGIAGCNLSSELPAQPPDAPDAPEVDAPPAARCSSATPFGTPQPIPELVTEGRSDQFSVTADELEVYYTGVLDLQAPNANVDIFHAQRAARTDPWQPGERIAVLSTTADDDGVRISPDGLSLFLDQGGDIKLTTRTSRAVEFAAPTTVSVINSASDDRWLSIDSTNRTIYFMSDRDGNRRLYRADRASAAVAFGAPVVVGGTEDLFSPLVTDDGLTLYFGIVGAGSRIDLFQSTRASTSDPFGPSHQLHEFDDANGGWPSSISPDGCRLYMLHGTNDFPDVLMFVAERQPLP